MSEQSECVTCGKWSPSDDACPYCSRACIEAEACARIATLLRRQRDEYREDAKKGGPIAHRMGEEMAAALIDGLANWVDSLPSSGDWKRGGHG